MVYDDEKDMHAGHRDRLLENVFNNGLKNMDIVQAMEFILCYALPRVNVNPVSHRLLKKYKNNIACILDASLEDLMAVRGMGKRAAMKLKCILDIFDVYAIHKARNMGINTLGEFFDYVENILRYKNVEECHIFGFDNKGEMIADRLLAKGVNSLVAIDVRDISNFVSTYNVPNVVIAHNHPRGYCTPSTNDFNTHKKLIHLLSAFAVTVSDDIVVGSDGIFSIAKNSQVRVFQGDEENYRKITNLIGLNNDINTDIEEDFVDDYYDEASEDLEDKIEDYNYEENLVENEKHSRLKTRPHKENILDVRDILDDNIKIESEDLIPIRHSERRTKVDTPKRIIL